MVRPRAQRWLTRLALLGAGLVVVWGGFRAVAAYRFGCALAVARQEVALGRFRAAEPRLTALSARWPGHDEVNYLLGMCAHRSGRPDRALAAWDRIPAHSPFAEQAAFQRGSLEIDRGRFAEAELVLQRALRSPGARAVEIRHLLIQLYWHEGRIDEARRLIERNWHDLVRSKGPRAEESLRTLSAHIDLDLHTYPAEGMRALLEVAASNAPDDDRVALGKANLALRSGDTVEADRLLRLCQTRRPRDPAVWRSRLASAMATGDTEQARQALRFVPVDQEGEAQALAIRAWFAAQGHDRTAEERLLQDLGEREPGNLSVLDRRAELASEAGRTDLVARLRGQKAERHRARESYQNLLGTADPVSHAEEFVHLATVLGRRFEAECWRTISASAEGRPAGAPSSPPVDPPAPRPTLAELLPDLVSPVAKLTPRAVERPRSGGAVPAFTDDTEAAGLRFIFENGVTPQHQLPETMSGGLGLLDYDGDGWLDLFAVQGGTFPPDPARPNDGDRLFRNRGDGRFEDVTAATGLAGMPRGYGHGVAVGDYDNDGHPDLFVTRWRGYALYHNRGDGRFEDATERADLDGDRGWPTSAAFADLDNDGDLDLYVCQYLAWNAANPRLCPAPDGSGFVYCNPHDFAALPDRVYRNDHGRFVDVTDEAEIRDPDGRGLGVVAADLDGDRRIDLYVANDLSANLLFRNLGRFRFEEIGFSAGAAANAEGGFQAGMGVACGDLDGDGRPDVAVTNFYGESTTFFHNLGHGTFCDHTAAVGLAAPSRHLLGFGIAFVDVENDGNLDLMSVNGHVSDRRPRFPWTMPPQLLIGGAGGHLTDVTRQAGPPFQALHLGRGLAVGDLDNDGRADGVVLSQNEPIAYLHNQSRAGHFLTLRLEGTASNRDGVGAEVALTAGGRRQVAQRFGGGSYQSAGDPRLHFGLGASAQVEELDVRWPSGRVDHYHNLAADTGYRLREGGSVPLPLAGWKR